jgi:hypothetical protein
MTVKLSSKALTRMILPPPAHLTSTYFWLSLAKLFVHNSYMLPVESEKPSEQLSFQFPQRVITLP